MQKTFTYFVDPAHGWVKASKSLLKELGIADKISSYSYQRGEDAFLEEDCDASLLVATLKERGIEPKFVERYSNKSSKIRNYESYAYLDTEQENELADLRLRMENHANWSPKALAQIRHAGLDALKYWQREYGF